MTDYEIRNLDLSGDSRARDGIIVSAREQKTGQLATFHEIDAPRSALTHVCERLDAMDGDWKIVSVCTPTSIYRDLQGHRQGRDEQNVSDPRTGEQNLLGLVGRLELLQPLKSAGFDRGAGRIA